MLAEVNFLCVDCSRPVQSLNYKHIKSIVQRCVSCYKSHCYGRCEHVSRKGKCPFKPRTNSERYCERHIAFAPKDKEKEKSQSKYSFKAAPDPFNIPSFDDSDFKFHSFSSSESSSRPSSSSSSSSKDRDHRSESPPRTRGRPKVFLSEHESSIKTSMEVMGLDEKTVYLTDMTPLDLRRQFRFRALELHPDKNIGTDTTKEFRDLLEAFAVLKGVVGN